MLRCSALSMVLPRLAGQPPIAMRSMMSRTPGQGSGQDMCSPARRPATEISPVESPTSYSHIGRIAILANRPAPLCRVTSSAGVDEELRTRELGLPA